MQRARSYPDRGSTTGHDEWLMTGVWGEASRELDLWSRQGLTARFWIRDDDASEKSAPLERLDAFAQRFDVTIGLAVIPGKMHPDLPHYLNGDARNFRPMCHGWKHINHGLRTRPSEFGGDRPLEQLVQDAQAAHKIFARHFCQTRPIFVPPFNRISNALIRRLPELGFAAVSAIPSRLTREVLGLQERIGWVPRFKLPWLSATPRIDVHIDLIDWKAQTAVDSAVIARALVHQLRGRRKAGPAAAASPIGLLTHHLVHDAAIWRLCDELLDMLRRQDLVQFIDLAEWSKQHGANGRETAGCNEA
jgi:peptidoglycan/xylan/chitin deacetylase (PgdA/CDA1 family)